MVKFRFEDLKVWQMAIEVADRLFDIADDLEQKHLFRFADQLRGAGMSISNNIAEGSGAGSSREFARYLAIARKSTFENANILILLHRRQLISDEEKIALLAELDLLCRRITSFQRSLRR